MNAIFRALADPTRREILELLRSGPLSSGQIAEHFPTTWPTVSRHLSVLKEAELILAERNGQHVHYELNTTLFHEFVHHLVGWIRPGGRDA